MSETVGATIPVDVYGIAPALGLTVKRGSFPRPRPTALYNHRGTRCGPAPGRFVIAHEIGHHQPPTQALVRKIEPEANAFASELLIPQAELKRRVSAGETMRALARTFDVSLQATFYALRSAKLINRISG